MMNINKNFLLNKVKWLKIDREDGDFVIGIYGKKNIKIKRTANGPKDSFEIIIENDNLNRMYSELEEKHIWGVFQNDLYDCYENAIEQIEKKKKIDYKIKIDKYSINLN